MTWTAPTVERVSRSLLPDERALLEGSLEDHRETFLSKCAGLTGEQLALRAVEPSTLSLLGMIRHLADAERWWFRTHVAGLELPDLFVTDAWPDADFDDLDPASAGEDYATYLSEVALCRAAVADLPLDHVFAFPRSGHESNLRWACLLYTSPSPRDGLL